MSTKAGWRVPVFTIFGILGGLLFSMFLMMLFVIFVLEYSFNVYITMENMGFYFIFAFILTLVMSGVFYKFYVERQARWFKA